MDIVSEIRNKDYILDKDILQEGIEEYKNEQKIRDEIIKKAEMLLSNEDKYMADKDFMFEVEKIITKARELFSKTKIKFLFTRTKDLLNNSYDYIEIQEDAKKLFNFSEGQFNFKDTNEIYKELQLQSEELRNKMIIRDRVQAIQDYFQTATTQLDFETYYYKKDDKNKSFNKVNREQKINTIIEKGYEIKIHEAIKKRYSRWIKNLNNNGIGYKGITTPFGKKEHKNKQKRKIVDDIDGELFAYSRHLNMIASLGVNGGQLWEALLHAASSIEPNVEEWNHWNELINLSNNNNIIIKYYWEKNKIKNALNWNIDEAMIMAKGQTPLYKGGDVNFIFIKDDGINYELRSYQAKASGASIQLKTLKKALFLLYDFFTGKQTIQTSDNITSLKDLLYEDIKIAYITKATPEYQKIIDQIPQQLESYIKNPLTTLNKQNLTL